MPRELEPDYENREPSSRINTDASLEDGMRVTPKEQRKPEPVEVED